MTIDAIVPSYLYKQYEDDDSLQAWVASYNALAQSYLDWIAGVNLPIYTGVGSSVSGDLLDWVGRGLYGYARPLLSGGTSTDFGVLNTVALDAIVVDGLSTVTPDQGFVLTDDVYRRCLTWHLHKGDGKHFSVRWLKRRVQRFLYWPNGTGLGVSETYGVSVTFGADRQVVIDLSPHEVSFGLGPLDSLPLDAEAIDHSDFTVTQYGLSPVLGRIFKSAVESGALELPFQYTWAVNL